MRFRKVDLAIRVLEELNNVHHNALQKVYTFQKPRFLQS